MDHLRMYPRDVYTQYVALQLARNEGRLQDTVQEVRRMTRVAGRTVANRQNEVDLFSIFSGQLAVQESLQLDTMESEVLADGTSAVEGRTGPLPFTTDRDSRFNAANTVPIAELSGPTIESHPWKELLADRSPQVTGLALSAPYDNYFVSFRSVNKLLDTTEFATLWGAHVFNQANREAQTQLVGKRLQSQLAVEANAELRPFYDAVVDEVALIGSDPFFREGSDLTMLFHAKQPLLFRAKMEQFLTAAETSRPDAERTTGKYLGIEYVRVATPDRQVHVFSAYPRPDLHVRSNSQAGLEHVLEAVLGRNKDGHPVERLGETDEFRYVRTLLPEGAAEEDGLVYLSDPFVRRLMGPALRLTEQRRLMCYNHLRMIGHAALMYRTQTGKTAHSLDELVAADCTPGKFGSGQLTCPEGGKYTLAADGMTGVCSMHGYSAYLTPCCEMETTHVTRAEADAYRRFVDSYNQYWRQYFDPIAVRLQISPEKYRVETIVLPLIDNSIYTRLAESLGGEPEALDALPVPKRNIFSFAVRVNKSQLLADVGLEDFVAEDDPQREQLLAQVDNQNAAMAMRRVLWALRYQNRLNRAAPSNQGLSWRVQVLEQLGQQALYKEFHLDEPWDSDHNRKLIARIPEVFRPANATLVEQGRPKFVVPRGKETVFPELDRRFRDEQVTDGTQNTITLLEVNDEHAVIWTKPDDIELDVKQAQEVLQIRPPGAFLVGTCNSQIQFLRQEIAPSVLAAMLTPAGRDTTSWRRYSIPAPPFRSSFYYMGRRNQLLDRLQVGELITKGVGNQIGFHVYDSEPMFDLELTRFMGMALSSFRGRRIDDEFLFIFPLLGALNGPVYISIPVQDPAVVDGFLTRLDEYLAELASRVQRGWFFSVDQDFYHVTGGKGTNVRAYSLEFGPLKWRFFWSRIGDAAYVASKREVLEDLAAPDSKLDTRQSAEDVGHALVRVRPQNWNRVLETYRLGWEENNRQACLHNLGPLSSLSRAIAAGQPGTEAISASELDEYARRVYDVSRFCPDEGQYKVSADGRVVSCSMHGTARDPQQGLTPTEGTALAQQLNQFGDLTIKLTFLEDGLHAVATLKRQRPDTNLTYNSNE